jgi:hypothetical protein
MHFAYYFWPIPSNFSCRLPGIHSGMVRKTIVKDDFGHD